MAAALAAGARLGPYEITGPIGSGGMGEVYRAHDARLGRDVAIKVLPQAVATDPERLARLEREARMLASFNHPNIAAIHGFEDSAGVPAIVMELVEGRTLAEILEGQRPKGTGQRLSVGEALGIAAQIAEALDVAHEHGIVHRDLKPANIKVRGDGTVKVLDFGLARTIDPPAENGGGSHAATITGVGLIVGTAAYMSPEQARGLTVDKRADIWAFGCIVLEMLTGRSPFAGASVTDTLVAVLEREPDWTLLPADTPEHVRRLLRRCLEKDPRNRLRDIGDARVELMAPLDRNQPAAPGPTIPRAGHRSTWAAVAALIVVLAAALAWWRVSPAPASVAEIRLDITTPATRSPESFAISPDGRQVVFAATSPAGETLWLRDLSGSSSRVLKGTDGGQYPFWSPDGRSIGFFAGGKLKRLNVDDEATLTLADAPNAHGGTWTRDDVILFAPTQISPLLRVPATGGATTAVTALAPGQLGHMFPEVLADGAHVLFLVTGPADTGGTYVARLDGSEPHRLLGDTAVAGPPGQVLFVREATLFAQAVDVTGGTVSPRPVRVADGVAGPVDIAFRPSVAASRSGRIVYRSVAAASSQLVWFDRSGNEVGRPIGPNPSNTGQAPALSRDGRTVAIARRDSNRVSDVWLYSIARSTLTRLTFGSGVAPRWSPDGTRVVFATTRNGNLDLFQKASDGSGAEEPLLVTPPNTVPADWSSDGNYLLFLQANQKTLLDVYALPMNPRGQPIVVVQSPYEDLNSQFSPDGSWIAYQSNESGRHEVYLRPFLKDGGRIQISTEGGTQPRWRADGRELYYLSLDGRMMAVPIAIGSNAADVKAGAPVPLFRAGIGGPGIAQNEYVPSADGQRFLIDAHLASDTAPITVILNWQPKP